jgi:hypothetical protein
MAGGQQSFAAYFHIENGEVLLNEGVDTSDLNAGLQLILDQVGSSDNYRYFAGTSGDDSALLFEGTVGNDGKLNRNGRGLATEFTCGGANRNGCGVLIGTSGRPNSPQPAPLENGNPVFALFAYNIKTSITQVGVGAAGDLAKAGIGQPISPASLFIHEAAENLAFRSQGNWNYPQAHDAGIRREANIRQDLGFGGGWAGAEIRTTIPRN